MAQKQNYLKQLPSLIQPIILIGVFYMIIFTGLRTMMPQEEFPNLRTRFGTILSHSSDTDGKFSNTPTGEEHLYCYYPKAEAQYSNKSGEYIIKREKSFEDCKDFYGAVVFYEGWWVSEREKLWWNKEHKQADELAQRQSTQTQGI